MSRYISIDTEKRFSFRFHATVKFFITYDIEHILCICVSFINRSSMNRSDVLFNILWDFIEFIACLLLLLIQRHCSCFHWSFLILHEFLINNLKLLSWQWITLMSINLDSKALIGTCKENNEILFFLKCSKVF